MKNTVAFLVLFGLFVGGALAQEVAIEDSELGRTMIQIMDDYFPIEMTDDRHAEMQERVFETARLARLKYQTEDKKVQDVCHETASQSNNHYLEIKNKLLGTK
jgi:hypothetical protein